MGDDRGLRVAVLGPLALSIDGAEIEVPGLKRRAVLALLARASPNPVSVDFLIDAIWPGEAPASGRAALQSHVSRLRRHLGPYAGRLSSAEVGYRLALHDGELDASCFDGLVREAQAGVSRDPQAACVLLTAACTTWQGAPLDELHDVEPLAAWARALTEAWLSASELLAECALQCGDPRTAMEAATTALANEPLRETAVLLSMRALAAQRRHADALRSAHDFRRRLRTETGLDASAALTALEGQIADGASLMVDVSTPPAVRSRAAPVSLGALLGREAELAGIERLLASDRLVTIVGPAGVGKTRLATEIANRAGSTGAVTVVELAMVTDPEALPDVVARALGLEAGHGDPLERCVSRLRVGRHLLVLDNCEHLIGAARALLTELLGACSALTVLATSRERLALGFERTSRLAPLPMPGTADRERIRKVPSVALFLDRAERVHSSFAPDSGELEAIARIVRALDGLPLAIELAAGRLSSLAVEDLEARLDRALDLLGVESGDDVDHLGRHRTLRAAVQWSYDLLTPDQQQLFRHLAVFPGGFDLDTAEMVARDLGTAADPAGTLVHLVESSMLVAELDGRPRYRMLDTLRSFGLDELAARGERHDADTRLMHWAIELAGELDAAYETEREQLADERLRTELPNLRAAWHMARDTGNVEAAASLAVDLYSHASWRELTELFRWSIELAADPALVGHDREAQVLGVAAEAQWSSTGDLTAAEALAGRAVQAIRPGDSRGFALATWSRADVLIFRGRYQEAGELAIAARDGTRWEAEGFAQAALAAAYDHDLDRATAMLHEAENRVGGPTLHAYLRYISGEIANLGRDFPEAKAAYGEAISVAREIGASFIVGIAAVGLVTAEAADGDVAAALEGYRELVALWERTGAWTQQWTTLRNLADLLERLDDHPTASALRTAADRAPEAAAVAGMQLAAGRAFTSGPDHDEVLTIARDAITRAERRLRPRA